ncbi:sulfatase-like hydrolase/transferase [Sabulilitoribacter arenilitoris]|uniref:Sulfatase-like hydrolase/transferase n=1 Tax=Wocania arenilitoris TaxID=2044858 RepID=A0AAE3EQ64_9FLAO|nr:sulfatase-like hydrolase/transferase [Wocania arenilitoris]
MILFVGDNGTSNKVVSIQNSVQVRGDKGQTTDAGTHVPFIANWKGTIHHGEVNSNLIDFTDFLPTLLQVANISIDRVETDGVGFYSQLIGKISKPRDWVFCHYAPNWGKFKNRRYVHDKKWKLYENGEFYDISKDKAEQYSLNIEDQSLAVQERVKEFKAILKEYQ